nr:immunoglobulin light chain junction region [Macaca mulatta]MOV94107.1 immunoglobulin light chain junction region [Macaca mulatta]
CMQGVQVPWTF